MYGRIASRPAECAMYEVWGLKLLEVWGLKLLEGLGLQLLEVWGLKLLEVWGLKLRRPNRIYQRSTKLSR
jgi:hypothetical protein